MWVLEHCKQRAVRFQLLPEREYTVGRKGCTINVEGDGSISRSHAILLVSAAKGEKESGVVVTDKSKFGTFVNERKLEPGKPFELKDGCMLRFGVQASTFQVKNEPFVVCFSTISGETKKELMEIVKKLGGRCEPSWTALCTCLVMNTITLTVKVVTAMASCRPIVTPQWLKEVLKAAEEAQVLPPCNEFLPPVGDKSIRDAGIFRPQAERASLFAEKTFMFLLKKDYTDLRQVVTLSGGQCHSLEEPLCSGQMKQLISEGTVVVLDLACRTKTKWTQQAADFTELHGRRCIHPSEIGFAVMSSSVVDYTNPTGSNPIHSQAVSMVASQAVSAPSFSLEPSLLSQQVQSSAPVHAALPTKHVEKMPATSTTHVCAKDKKETEKTVATATKPNTSDEQLQPKRNENTSNFQKPSEPAVRRSLGLAADKEKITPLRPDMVSSEVLATPSQPPAPSHSLRSHRTTAEVCIGETELSRATDTQPVSIVPSSQPEFDEDDRRQLIAPAPFMVRSVKRAHDNEPVGSGSPAKRVRRLSPVRAVRSHRTQKHTEDDLNEEDKSFSILQKPTGSECGVPGKTNVDLAPKHVSIAPMNSSSFQTGKYVAKIEVDQDLPKQLMRCETVDLCPKRPQVDRLVEQDTAGVNFKKFRKIRGSVSGARRGIPCIIGGDQLTVHVNNSCRELEEFLMQEREANAEMHQQDEYGEELFRMDPPQSSRQPRR